MLKSMILNVMYKTPHTRPLLISVASLLFTPDCTLCSSSPRNQGCLSYILLVLAPKAVAHVIPSASNDCYPSWTGKLQALSLLESFLWHVPIHSPPVLPRASANFQRCAYRVCYNDLFRWPLPSGSVKKGLCLFITVSQCWHSASQTDGGTHEMCAECLGWRHTNIHILYIRACTHTNMHTFINKLKITVNPTWKPNPQGQMHWLGWQKALDGLICMLTGYHFGWLLVKTRC